MNGLFNFTNSLFIFINAVFFAERRDVIILRFAILRFQGGKTHNVK